MTSRRPGTRTADEKADESSTVALGWACGLGLLVVPWLGAGILATFMSVLDSEALEPERTFPWLVLAVLLAGLGGLAYGSVRVPGFRRGAVPATAIALVLLVGGFVAAWVLA